MIKLHASSLGLIMTQPKAKGELLSVGAKTHIENLAKQHVYGYRPSISTKEMQKGLIVEADSIALLNEVTFSNHTKNTQRKENEWLTGECDIDTGTEIKDIKSSWSLCTFPATSAEGEDKLYDWQLRAYMMLYNRNAAALAYCMVDTPDELIGYESEEIHKVSHIDPDLRVTESNRITRDGASEAQIIQKCQYAQQYFNEAVAAIVAQHSR